MALTSEDLSQIETLITLRLDMRLKPLEKRMDTFVTKDEFYTMMDKILFELKNLREEFVFVKNSVLDHEERLPVVETRLAG